MKPHVTVEERWESGLPVLGARVVREPVETLLVYPDSEEIIEFLVSIDLVKKAARLATWPQGKVINHRANVNKAET